MASAQASKEIHVVHTFSAKDCAYQATGGEWKKPTEENPTAELVKATSFRVSAGMTNSKLKKLKGLTLGFEISIGDGTPSMKDANARITYALRAHNGGSGGVRPVQDQINNMKPNSRTWVSVPISHPASFESLDLSFENMDNSMVVGGLTFYQAKVEEIGEE